MRVLIAPDKFKGSISASEAAEAIARGWRAIYPDAVCTLAPIADGGEGFADALRGAMGGEWVSLDANDPLGRKIEARYAWVAATKLAIIDMSEASGLWRLKPDERDPLRANTFGTGQLIRHAAERGAARILLGLGGSATTDGGLGMAAALGYAPYTSDGEPIAPEPRNFLALERIGCNDAMELPEIVAACDVGNPLLGPRGTARVFAPQKGACAQTVETLELGLENVADVVRQDLGCDFRDTPGAGAAGGIGFGLLSFCHASTRSGFDLVAEVLKLEEAVAGSDLILTGEGRIDSQTLEGKGPAGVAAMARRHGKPVVAFAGSVADEESVGALFDAVAPIIDRPVSLEDAMKDGADFLERGARRAASLLRVGGKWR